MGAASRNRHLSCRNDVLKFSCACLLILPVCLLAQVPDPGPKPLDPAQTLQGHLGAGIHVTVLDASNSPLPQQVLIRFHSAFQDTTTWQVTDAKSQTLFVDQPFGSYDIQASAVGYLSAQTAVNVASMAAPVEVKLTLQPDPAADMDNDAALSPHALHEINRAVRSLRAGDLKDAQKRLEELDKTPPPSARVKYLLGFVYFGKGDAAQAQAALEQATRLNPGSARAWSLLGRINLMAVRPQQAVTALERAVAANPSDWVAHDLLADAYLVQHQYEQARRQAELAASTGDQDGTAAQLALGEALANLGKRQEAIAALKEFLNANRRSIAAQHADELLRLLERSKSKSNEKWTEFEAQVAAFDLTNDLIIAPQAELPASSWIPRDVDHSKPATVAGLACPYQQVIDGASSRVEQLMSNVQRISAIESIGYERFDQGGNVVPFDNLKFDYAATVSQKPDVVLIDEYRSQRYDRNVMPDRIADNGFAVLALVFHPTMRDAFKMDCEGLGEWHGKPAWLVRFQQRSDHPNHMQAYLVGDIAYPVDLKGRAWIAADSFQILRIESDMVKPMPVIGLAAEHIVTEYSPVAFRKSGYEFWLPQTAEVYMQFRGQRYHHKHTFDKYMVFTVDAQEKVHEANQDPAIPKSTNPPKTHKSSPA